MYTLSPISIRVARVRERYRTTRPKVCTARLRLVTDFYQSNPQLTGALLRAKNFKNLCEKMPLLINDDELIVGSLASTYRGSAVYPENDISWFVRDYKEGHTLQDRPLDKYDIDQEDVDYIFSVSDYWSKNSLMAQVAAYMPEGYLPSIGNGVLTYGKEIANTPIGHFCANYDKAIRKGFGSILAEAKAKREMLEGQMFGDSAEKYFFYKSVELVSEGIIIFAKRYAEEARRLAGQEENETRKKELLDIAECIDWAIDKPCRTFREAAQTLFFYHMCLCMDANMHGITLGRVDQYLGSFYEADIAQGRITPEQGQEILDLFYLKIAELNKVWSFRSTQTVSGYTSGMLMTLGGVDKDGNDATNPVTYMMLQSAGRLALHDPPQSLRIHKGTPPELWEAGIRTTMIAGGVPTFQNDDLIIPTLVKERGMSLESARNYCLIGCVEPAGTGDDWPCCGGSGGGTFWNMPNAFLQAINNGQNPLPGPDGKPTGQTGVPTGYLYEMESFEDLLEAVKKQFHFFIDWQVSIINSFEYVAAQTMSQPLVSATVDNCLEKGQDVMRGGAKNNGCGLTGIGLGNIVDCLGITKYLVYDKKEISAREFYDAFMSNWEGKEELRQYIINKVPHYGNDNPYFDKLATWVAQLYGDRVRAARGPRGQYTAGLWPVATHVVFGKVTAATPDGRKSHDPLSDGISPVQQRDKSGPTAVLKSVSRVPQGGFANGTLLNMKFHPSSVNSEKGIEEMKNLIETYFSLNGMEMQLNIVGSETLKEAQKNPEKHQNLVVRVAGFSSYFVELTKDSQDDVIHRTELAL
jgi:formate C-acetyltransferase